MSFSNLSTSLNVSEASNPKTCMPFLSPDSNPYHYSNRATKINDFLSGEREDQDDDKFQLASFKDQQGEQLSVSQRERGGERCGDALIKKEGDSRVGQTVLQYN